MEYKIIPALSFDFLTPFYDICAEILGYGKKQCIKVVKLLNLNPYEKLLDVGCGTGTLLLVAKELHPEVEMIGTDIDYKILKRAKKKIDKKNIKIKLIRASADKQPFKNTSIEKIVSTLIFHHLPTDIKKGALKEIYRILKPDGRFLLADFGEASDWWLKSLAFLVKIFNLPEAETLKDNIEGKIPELLNEAGFTFREVAPRYKGIQFLEAKK